MLIPIISEIDKPMSWFLNSCFEISSPFVSKWIGCSIDSDVSFAKFIKNFGEVSDHLITAIDRLLPYSFKSMPIISHFYSNFVQKSHQILKCIKNDSTISAFLRSIHEGGGVIVEMLKSGASSYKDINTPVESITKGITPTTFIDVYQTASGISVLNNRSIKIKSVANSITFDSTSKGKSSLTFNDILPIKYFTLNSDELTDSTQSGFLYPEQLAKGFAGQYEDLYNYMFDIIKSILAEPSGDIKSVAISLGHNKMYTDAIVNSIGVFSNKVYNGENVKTKTNQYLVLKNGKSLSGGAIAGIVIAVLSVVTLAAVGVGYLYQKKEHESDTKAYGLSLIL